MFYKYFEYKVESTNNVFFTVW